MTVYNLGSINADYFYRVPHMPKAGETLAATQFKRGLGGKGANMSVAAARAAAQVVHIGAIGQDGRWARDALLEYGVFCEFIETVTEATGHAVIMVDPSGENQIILHGGANQSIDPEGIGRALSEANAGDIFITQNETDKQAYAMSMARNMGLRTVYAAAPFDVQRVTAVLADLDMLILNEVEAAQLLDATGSEAWALGVHDVVVTRGTKGADWYHLGALSAHIPARPVVAVDTTGAGDTFTGYLIAGLDRGLDMEAALELATKAAAIMVTRHGTAEVIPDLRDIIDTFGE